MVVTLDFTAQFADARGSPRRIRHQENRRNACAEPAGRP